MFHRLFCILAVTALAASTAHADPSGIRSVDWRNFSYAKSPDSIVGDSAQPIKLHNGQSSASSPDDMEISRLAPVRYADFKGDGHEEAAVEIVTPVAARRAEEDNIYVFDWHDGRPRQIFFRMYTSGARLQVTGRSLVILWPDASPPDPVHWTKTAFRWRGSQFEAVSNRSIAPVAPEKRG